jgi:hypothetical protein
MTKFSLVQKSTNRTQTTFHVMADGAIVGSINVPPNQVGDLLKHWKGPQSAPPTKPATSAADKAARGKSAIVAAFKKGRPLTKAALLRS